MIPDSAPVQASVSALQFGSSAVDVLVVTPVVVEVVTSTDVVVIRMVVGGMFVIAVGGTVVTETVESGTEVLVAG